MVALGNRSPAGRRAPPDEVRSVHLLVIEDDPRLLRLLRRLLGQDGHIVEGASTATEGLEIAEDIELDAIVLDVGLPDLDGFEVARRLRKRGATLPILMLTARDAVASRVQGLDAGADDYLVKPFAYEELAARLRALSRRPSPRQTPNLQAGPIELDEAAHRVTRRWPRRRPRAARVRRPRVPPAAPGPGPVARPAARLRLAIRRGSDAQHGRGLHPHPAREAGPGRRGLGRDRPRRRLPDPPGLSEMSVAAAPPMSTDSALLRRTRLRLMLWSGGLTLVVLVILGGVVYVTVSRALAAGGTAVLQDRATDVAHFVAGPAPGPRPGRSPIGVSFGGRGSGTLAIVVQPDGTVQGLDEDDAVEGLPDEAGIAAAQAGRTDVRTADVEEIPVRILSQPVARDDGVYVVQIVGERLSEQRLLDALTIALVGGGLAALLLACGVGYVYAGRALVPIRDAMGRRDEALLRQREFTANASHELRTPLTVIRASVDDLRRNRTQRVADVGDALEDIEVEVGHVTALVDDLLLLARTDAGALELHLEPIDLADIAAEAAGALTATAAERQVAIVVDPRPAPMSGDALRIRQLVTILIDNAVRHSPPGGEVLVTVRSEAASVSLQVDDAGRGIRPDERQLVFERFWRADDAPQGGTGLGLAIAAWIVAQHGGLIEALDAPHGGARFRARMPARVADASLPLQERQTGG